MHLSFQLVPETDEKPGFNRQPLTPIYDVMHIYCAYVCVQWCVCMCLQERISVFVCFGFVRD